MTNGQRTVTTMLAVVAVMLGLNLIVRGSPPALAGGQTAAGPVQPVPVALAMTPQFSSQGQPTNTFSIVRLWNDGAVDLTRVGIGTSCTSPLNFCSGPDQVIPGSCMADVDRDGDVAVPDLLTLLAAWGPCQ